MRGKTVLITGATSGLGLATALLLAEQGAEVVMVGRDRTRGNFMRAEIAKYAAGNVPILFLADLSSQEEIYQLAEKLHGSFSRIDVLINNAAAMFADREVTPEGLEKTFAINHLAPFILTHLVLDLIRAAPAGRILTASSEFHSGILDFSNLHAQARKRGSGAKAVRGNRRSCEAPREFVGKENVAELRALVGAQPVISPLPLQIGKIQCPAVELRGRGQDSPGGRGANEVEHKVSQGEGREMINGEGLLQALRRHYPVSEHRGRIVDQQIDP
jgi:hypothetical protein